MTEQREIVGWGGRGEEVVRNRPSQVGDPSLPGWPLTTLLLFGAVWHLKCRKKATVFTRINDAAFVKFFAPQMRRLFEGAAYLKNCMPQRNIPFNGSFSICMKILQELTIASVDFHHLSFRTLFISFITSVFIQFWSHCPLQYWFFSYTVNRWISVPTPLD